MLHRTNSPAGLQTKCGRSAEFVALRNAILWVCSIKLVLNDRLGPSFINYIVVASTFRPFSERAAGEFTEPA